MVNIIYRHYKPGDEVQLADLFNSAFQMNGGGFVRTPKSWYWRYINSPKFEPEQCHLAEDSDNGKLIGAIYSNLIEKIPINGREYLVGDINDVSCHPDYTGQGVAKRLMDMAVEYMEKKGCDLSILTADFNGFPRKKIYLPYGYRDVDREYLFVNFPNIPRMVKDMPVVLGLLPLLFINSLLFRFLNRINFRFNSSFKDFSYEIVHNKKHFEYMHAANRIIPQYYEGFHKYTKERILWSRIKVASKSFKPTYIMIKKKGKIIGGATLTHQNIYAFKFGIKFRVGYLHDFFLDKKTFPDQKALHLGYVYLIDKILKAATKRWIGVFIFMIDSKEKVLHRALRSMRFLKFKGAAVMIKPMHNEKDVPMLKKPLFIPTYVSKGVP